MNRIDPIIMLFKFGIVRRLDSQTFTNRNTKELYMTLSVSQHMVPRQIVELPFQRRIPLKQHVSHLVMGR